MGFKPKPKGVRITCPVELLEPEEGSDALFVVIKRLTLGELHDLPSTEEAGQLRFDELAEVVAPYIVDWNFEQTDVNGEDGRLAPPAEEGPQQLYAADPLFTAWLYNQIRQVHLGGEDLPKGPRHSSATPAPSNGSGNGSPQAKANSRRNQTVTTS